ncbi:hypothetical protein ACIBEA_15140 [Streptomyces sp. NPDC051555]|uniref:hypothetical protein n=1 Tax=Streptomyces sp. NPDC051555 TaxID=3365657 RepID=UPI0037BAC996
MTRITPPRPIDIEALFPDLAGFRRTATRLHPRPGEPSAQDSSVAGPMLWPADEPWPVCTAVHPKGKGYRTADVRLARRIEADARGRTKTDTELQDLTRLQPATHAPEIHDEDPIPLLAIAQLWARDVPDLRGPEGYDLLQVFWCPFEAHGPTQSVDVVLKWRRAADTRGTLSEQPEPVVVGRQECVPDRCVVHPEQVTEHEYIDLLPADLRDAIDAWQEDLLDEDEDEDEENDDHDPFGIEYGSALSIAPGWKVGGFATWHATDPRPVDCQVCGTPMPPLLTVHHVEWDPASASWAPEEDRRPDLYRHVITPTQVYVGRGYLRIHTCPTDPWHPHRLSFQ